jgi:type II secretory pathway component PulC
MVIDAEHLDQKFVLTTTIEDPPTAQQAKLFAQIVVTGDYSFAIPAAVRDAVLKDPFGVAGSVRLVQAKSQHIPVGMKVYDVQPDSLFDVLGIQNGDILVEVNGMPLETDRKAVAALSQLRNKTRVTAKILRHTKPFLMTYEIK